MAEGSKEERRSVDSLINKEGKELIAKVEERRWGTLNESFGTVGIWT